MFSNLIQKQALGILTNKMKEGGFNSVFFYEDPTNLETGFTFEFYETEKPVMVIPKKDVEFIKAKLQNLENENGLLFQGRKDVGELVKKISELQAMQLNDQKEIAQLKNQLAKYE